MLLFIFLFLTYSYIQEHEQIYTLIKWSTIYK